MMDYLKIVLTGYLNPDTLPFLENYFFREFEEAQTKNYSPSEFYAGCKNVLRAFEADLAEKLQKRQSEINAQRVEIVNTMAMETDEKEREELKEMKDSLFKESKSLTIGDFEVNLLGQKWGGINARLKTSDILIIEKALESSYLKVCPPPKSSDEEFQDLITEINITLLGKNFDEKVEWFEENMLRIEGLYGDRENKHVQFEISGEDFFAYSFAAYKKDNPDITKEKFIKFQIEHLRGAIRRAEGKSTLDGDTPEKMVHRRGLLSYFESFSSSNETATQNSLYRSLNLNENPIFLELIGLIGKHNTSKRVGQLAYIPSILKKYNLTPIDARNIVIQMKYSVSPEWRKNVIPHIIDDLNQMSYPIADEENNIKGANDTTAAIENPHPKIFTSAKAFKVFEELKSEIVTERTEYADYSFIFEVLLKDGFLVHRLSHKEFMDYLADFHKIKFAGRYSQFKSATTPKKTRIYSNVKKRLQ